MTNEGVFEKGDIYTSPKGIRYIAVRAATDGCGCHVCDDGKQKCAFLRTGDCPKCHSAKWGGIDYVGGRVIFIKI